MLRPFYTKQFDRDLKKMLKRGKNTEKIKSIISRLINEQDWNQSKEIIN